MTDTYWVVRLEAFSFETKEEADAFRDKMEDAVTDAVKGATTRADTVLLSIMNAYKLKKTASNGDTLVQYNSRSYKYPFVFRKAADGKLYKLDAEMAKIRFAA